MNQSKPLAVLAWGCHSGWSAERSHQLNRGDFSLAYVIGLLGVWIAFAQLWLARNRLRLDLFDKRMAVFEAMRDAAQTAVSSQTMEMEALREFTLRTAPAYWLFDSEIADYIKAYRHKLAEVLTYQKHLDVQEYRDKHEAAILWLCSEGDTIAQRLRPYMQIDEAFGRWAGRQGAHIWHKIRPQCLGMPAAIAKR